MIQSFVINLEICPERLEKFQNEWPENDIIARPNRWAAVHGDSCPAPLCWTAGYGAWGCMRSHQSILEYALQHKLPAIAVFEDDAFFAEDFAEQISKFYNALPDDWQQAYLGGDLMHKHTHRPKVVNEHVLRPFNVNRTHAMMYGRMGMVEIYKHISNLPYEQNHHIDHHLGRWHEDSRSRVYCPYKWLVGQHGFMSNVSGTLEKPTFFEAPGDLALTHSLYLNPKCVVYRGSPSLIPELRRHLHFGNQINNIGLDVTLQEALRLREPWRAISGWFWWVRSEIVLEKSPRLPAIYAPGLSDECIRTALPDTEIILVEHVSSVKEVLDIIHA